MPWPTRWLYALCLALTLATLSSAASVNYKARNAPGMSTTDTYLAIRNEILKAGIHKRDIYSSNASIERRWEDATLLKLGHERTAMEIQARPIDVGGMVEIICTECYVKGTASAHLHIEVEDPVAHIKEVVANVSSDVWNVTQEFTDYTVDYVGDYLEENFNIEGIIDILGNLVDGGPQWSDLELPTFNYTVDIDIEPIPECSLKFQFDGLELYMNMTTILEAAIIYEIPLFHPSSPIGLTITPDLELGVFFTVDLILNVDGEIDISSGFHIKLEDGIAIEITLFGDEVSDITLPGGQFDFLPVVIESAGIVFSAILRVGVHAGFQIALGKKDTSNKFHKAAATVMPEVSGGIEVGIFANVAEFITNITYTPEEDCKRNVVQSYQLALGAKAGATVAIGNDTWGPMPETSVPVWYTELGNLCAGEKAPATVTSGTITTAPADRRRQDLITTTVTQEFIHTGVNCLQAGLINCPASLKNTSQSTETRTIVTAIPPGSTFAFPTTVMDTVASPVAFRKEAMTIPATTGSPVSFIPPPPASTSFIDGLLDDAEDALDDAAEDAKDNYKNNKPLILGLSIGLGGAAILAIIAAIIFIMRRRAQQDISSRGAYTDPHSAPKMVDTPITPATSQWTPTTPAMTEGYMDYKAVKGASVEERAVDADATSPP